MLCWLKSGKSGHPCLVSDCKWKAFSFLLLSMGFPGGSVGKEPACNAGDTRDTGLTLGSGRCPGEGRGSTLQRSYAEQPVDGEAWRPAAHRVASSCAHCRSWAQGARGDCGSSCPAVTVCGLAPCACSSLWHFTIRGCWVLSDAYFYIYWDEPMLLILDFINVVSHIDL